MAKASPARGRQPDADEDLVRLYLEDISRHPLLTKEDEVGLARRIEAGRSARAEIEAGGRLSPSRRRELEAAVRDAEAATRRFVNANLRLVVSIAKRFQYTGLPLLDLVQEGNLGLIHAVGKFEWRRGFKFSTYATWWIRQAIVRGVANTGRTIRLPVHASEELTRVLKAKERLESELGRVPTRTELAAETDRSEQDVERVLQSAREVRSLSEPLGADSERELGQVLADATLAEPFEEVARALAEAELDHLLGVLDSGERAVLRLRFGLDGGGPRKPEEVAEDLDLPRGAVRRMEAKALAKLRHPSSGHDLLEMLPAS